MKDIKLVGDYLGTTEEFLPGKGTYTDEGKIYASISGEKILDSKEHVAKVLGKSQDDISVGDVVFGEVFTVRESVVQIIVKKIMGSSRKIDVKTGIHISNIADEYVENAGDNFGIGDIVKAKVIKIIPGMVDLTTKGNFGVVKAFCKKCRHPLIKSGENLNLLECKNCGSKESRRTASDYGDVSEM
ncbi:hypothetical protein BEH94_10330 [Candidatus Altiarchaeales archaeon WOR_SM1_SCG]|nr:hypothetical protein BEH94_10330 [Candidatus Altiarchaeales archaeon WOR_SM1_SCG]ODS39362.1 MAG: hypothetical protein A7315_11170 [Candidatus Altiarchaeales archaeon WOR_SM1_79]